MATHKLIAAHGIIAAAVTTLIFSACSGYPTCTDRGNCPDNGGTGGTVNTAGASGAATGGTGGTTAGNSSSGAAGNPTGGTTTGGSSGAAGEAGAAGGSPCEGSCAGAKPVCDAATNTCVECLRGSDCKDDAKAACDTATNTCVECVDKTTCSGATPACDVTKHSCVECTAKADCPSSAKPFCDASSESCVACLQQSDCTSATASVCVGNTCTACTKDADCSNIAGKGVCNAGTCVQCTIAKESVCSGKSCDPATDTCTKTPTGSVSTCEPCVADSECVGGNQSDPDARCVPMNFMGVSRQGGFCLRRVARTCAKPYQIPIMATSLSGASSENYCGIAQDLTRCEAVLDLVAGADCPDGKDSSCGCVRDATGSCLGAGTGGLCRLVGVNSNKCTYECGGAPQCPGGYSCAGVPTTYCQ